MRVSLFGLFLRHISLMESWPKLVRLILLVFGFIRFYQFYRFYVSSGNIWCCLICFIFCLHICSCMRGLTTRFSMHIYNSNLSIYVCSSLQAIWHSHYHSLESFESPGFSCPDLGACSLWILPVADQSAQLKCGSPADRPEPYPFKSPYASLEFSFCKLVSAFCTVHTCISLYILAFAPIGDVIFL